MPGALWMRISIFPPQIPQGLIFPSLPLFLEYHVGTAPPQGVVAPVGAGQVVAPCGKSHSGDRVRSPQRPQVSPKPRPHPSASTPAPPPSPVPRTMKRRKRRFSRSPGTISCPQVSPPGWDTPNPPPQGPPEARAPQNPPKCGVEGKGKRPRHGGFRFLFPKLCFCGVSQGCHSQP